MIDFFCLWDEEKCYKGTDTGFADQAKVEWENLHNKEILQHTHDGCRRVTNIIILIILISC